jgi:hypothetical protein
LNFVFVTSKANGGEFALAVQSDQFTVAVLLVQINALPHDCLSFPLSGSNIFGLQPFFLSRPLETVLLTLFLVEHTCALDRAVVGNHLGEISSKCGLTALNRRDVENLESLLREGPRQEQCA